MQCNRRKSQISKQVEGELSFIPRIINPEKIRKVVIFSGDGSIRQAGATLQAEMPWVRVSVLTDPAIVAQLRSDEGVAVIMDDAAINIADCEVLRQNNREVMICLLSRHKLIQTAPPSISLKEFPYTAKADLVFAVNKEEFLPERIVCSVVRLAEDHLNIQKRPALHRFILLLVDDEPSWASYFLPILYGMIGQRAVVKLTRTYEETLEFLFGVENEDLIRNDSGQKGYGDQVVCLITDIFFPKGDVLDGRAGQDLIRLVNKYLTHIPIIIASKAKEASELADMGYILPKGDPGSLDMLKDYIRDRAGMGDFVVYDDAGRELHRLKNIRAMYQLLCEAAADSPEGGRLRKLLETYGENDRFSTWFYMHSLTELGDRLRPQKKKGREMINILKHAIGHEIGRMVHTPLMIEGIKVFDLQDLLEALNAVPCDKIRPYSDNDIISSWLDYQGYSELAEELRPLHGKGLELAQSITETVERWKAIYEGAGSGDLSGGRPE